MDTSDKALDEFINRLEAKIRHDENGVEFWHARELQVILEYGKWDNFKNVINKALQSCEASDIVVSSHFREVIPDAGNNPEGRRPIPNDFQLTRYACYLIAQNADARKKIVASMPENLPVAENIKKIEQKQNKLEKSKKQLKRLDSHNINLQNFYAKNW